jgi:hypothetical protein
MFQLSVFVATLSLFFLAHTSDALSAEGGTLTGTYTVLAWHPILGKQEATVTIPANGDARTDFSFTAK